MAARYLVEAKLWIDLERGPEPTPEEVHEAVARLVTGQQIHAHVADDGEGGFGGSRLFVESGEMSARRID